jgi:hypothetical protein
MFEYNPYPKEKQLRKVPKKKKKEVYKGRVIPKKKERTKISKTNYLRMIEEFGDSCLICKRKPIDAHHLVFRSQFGSGNWRNLAPLCKEHHMKAHKDYNFAEYLRQERAERFGSHFWKDKYTLFKEGLIPTPTDEMFERFMQEQEKKVSEKNER